MHSSFFSCFPVILCGLLAPGSIQADSPRKPNVLFIVCDDLNNNLGCYGHPVVKSPHIDKLAARGVRFERAYCQYPICNPSRTSFLSGYRPGKSAKFLKDAVWLSMLFRNSGYVLAEINKVAHTPEMAKLCGFDARKKGTKVVPHVIEFLAENKNKPFSSRWV
jgi:arylsulfatase A-like enzyme